MNKKILAGLVGGLLVLSTGIAMAQPGPGPHGPGYGPGPHGEGPRMEQARKAYRIQHRIDAQEREIREGIRNGSLNKREARMLRDNLKHIKYEYQRAKRTDRFVTMEERARLDNLLDRNARMIRRMENNAVTRF